MSGITRAGASGDQVTINEAMTDPFSIFVEGGDYFHNLSDGYNTDLDEIVRNILIAKDTIMMARVDTQGRMDMINTRREQIVQQYKSEAAVIKDIAQLIEQAKQTEQYYFQILTQTTQAAVENAAALSKEPDYAPNWPSAEELEN